MRTKQKIKSNLTLPEIIMSVCAVDKELFVCSGGYLGATLNEYASVMKRGRGSSSQHERDRRSKKLRLLSHAGLF